MHARLFSRCAAPALFATLAVVSAPAIAQPTFGNPSPTAGSLSIRSYTRARFNCRDDAG